MESIHPKPERVDDLADLTDLTGLSIRLRDALRRVVDYLPGLRPADVGRRFGVNKDTSSRIVACCQIEDGLEFAYRCPSPATLRRVIDSARDLGSPAAAGAARAVDEFERHVRTEFGDQSTMNVLIGSVHPDLGEKAEAVQKQSVFRGMSQLHGLFVDVSIQIAVLWRGEEPRTFRHAWADGCVGLRRLRPGPPVVIGSWRVDGRTGEREPVRRTRVITDDWGRIPGVPPAPAGSPWVRPRVVEVGGAVQVRIDADVLGTRNAVNYGVVETDPDSSSSGPDEASVWCGVGQLVSVPAKLLVYDLLVERGLFDDAAPELLMYDTAMRGTSPLFDPSREFDRLYLHERVDPLVPGPDGHRSTDAPFIPNLVRYTLEACGLSGRAFRGYRLRQSYPIYGSQVAFAFRRG